MAPRTPEPGGSPCPERIAPGWDVCTGNNGGRGGACFGDSGSPAVKKGADGRWEVVAVASRIEEPCASIYAGVPQVRAWIKEKTGIDV